MSRRYVCSICGRSVATFESWRDVDPSELIELLESELQSHNVDTGVLATPLVLGRFRILDEDDVVQESPGASKPGPDWEGQ